MVALSTRFFSFEPDHCTGRVPLSYPSSLISYNLALFMQLLHTTKITHFFTFPLLPVERSLHSYLECIPFWLPGIHFLSYLIYPYYCQIELPKRHVWFCHSLQKCLFNIFWVKFKSQQNTSCSWCHFTLLSHDFSFVLYGPVTKLAQ